MSKRILAGLLTGALLLSLAVPAYAEDAGSSDGGSGSGSGDSGTPPSEESHSRAPKLKQLKAFVKSVDVAANKVMIRKRGKVVDVTGAVVVVLEGETARVGSLADLAAGDKVQMWVLKKRTTTGEYKAVLILKGQQPPRRRAEAPPEEGSGSGDAGAGSDSGDAGSGSGSGDSGSGSGSGDAGSGSGT